jgi:diphthamide biosynthesis protein 2
MSCRAPVERASLPCLPPCPQIHYGRASLTKVSHLPAFFVFPRRQLDVAAAADALAASDMLRHELPVMVFVDQPHLHQLEELKQALQHRSVAARLAFPQVPSSFLDPEGGRGIAPCPRARDACSRAVTCCMDNGGPNGATSPSASSDARDTLPHAPNVGQPFAGTSGASGPWVAGHRSQAGDDGVGDGTGGGGGGGEEGGSGGSRCSLAGYVWDWPTDALPPERCGFVWVGGEQAPALQQLQLTYSGSPWGVYESEKGLWREGLPMEMTRLLKRRYYLVEKARNAGIVGEP